MTLSDMSTFIMFQTVIFMVLLAKTSSQGYYTTPAPEPIPLATTTSEGYLPMRTFKSGLQAHFLASRLSTEKVLFPISEMTDGNILTCARTFPGRGWIVLMSSNFKRIIPSSFAVRMRYDDRFRTTYMVDPKVYMTDQVISENLPELNDPQFRRCDISQSNISPQYSSATLTCKGQAGTYAIIEFGNTEGINICEIEVLGKYDINLALRKPAGMNDNADAAYGVDGSGHIANHNVRPCAQGGKHVHPYFWVNLGKVYDIEMVKIVNRAYDGQRLNGLALFIKDSQPSTDETYFKSGKCSSIFGQAAGGAYVLPCFGRGRFVVAYIESSLPTYLTICEMEVYRRIPNNIALKAVAVGSGVQNSRYLTDGSTAGPAAELRDTPQINVEFPEHQFFRIESLKIYSTVDITVTKIGTGYKSDRACVKDIQLQALPHVNEFRCANGIIAKIVDFVFQNGVTGGIKEIEIYGKPEPHMKNVLQNVTLYHQLYVFNTHYLNDGSLTSGSAELRYDEYSYPEESRIGLTLPRFYQIERIRIFSMGNIPVVKMITGFNTTDTCVGKAELQAMPHVNEFMCANNIVAKEADFVFGKIHSGTAAIAEIEIYGKKTQVSLKY